MSEYKFPVCVDNTIRNAFLSCPTRAMYTHCKGLRPKEPNVDLHAGGAFASGLEATRCAFFVDGVNAHDAVEIGVEALLKAYGVFISPTATNKTANRMAGALGYYFQQYPLESEQIIPVAGGIEMPISFGLGLVHPDTGEELQYGGRFDLYGVDANGQHWLVDEKTTSRLGDSWYTQWALDSQMTGYLYGLRTQRIDAYAQVRGVAITKNDYGHATIDIIRPGWILDRWFKQAQNDFKRMISAYVVMRDYGVAWDMALNKSCNDYGRSCEFTKLCLSPNPERMTGEYDVVFWNPLERKGDEKS